MGLIVQKFGGSSVANAERVMNVARIVTDTYRQGNDVVVVVSAQGDTTDDLIAKAHEINEKPSKRELDMLMTSGEQISIALLSMAIEKLGCPAVSLLGWQAGFNTSSSYGSARIKSIKLTVLKQRLTAITLLLLQAFRALTSMTTSQHSAEAEAIQAQLQSLRQCTQTAVRYSPMLRAYSRQIRERFPALKSFRR